MTSQHLNNTRAQVYARLGACLVVLPFPSFVILGFCFSFSSSPPVDHTPLSPVLEVALLPEKHKGPSHGLFVESIPRHILYQPPFTHRRPDRHSAFDLRLNLGELLPLLGGEYDGIDDAAVGCVDRRDVKQPDGLSHVVLGHVHVQLHLGEGLADAHDGFELPHGDGHSAGVFALDGLLARSLADAHVLILHKNKKERKERGEKEERKGEEEKEEGRGENKREERNAKERNGKECMCVRVCDEGEGRRRKGKELLDFLMMILRKLIVK